MDITPLHLLINSQFSAKEATKQDEYCSDKYCSTSVNKIQSQKTTFVKKNQSRFLVDKKNIQATLSLPLMQYLFALMYALKFFCRGVDESLVKPGGVIRSSID
ncbi:hypothetical protein T4C_1228 [Trichinella pseudospiralis]|uniref:Uncharacterized protein n=1 Tax=Trichinella pseudospiralis TaxID=6337 RepID=A0A0V1JLG9_TRIPS|nr:hypothetical protein T4C_1228 [Trichinella pseudospiralis]